MYKLTILWKSVLILPFLFLSCNDDGDNDILVPEISGISPTSGAPGTSVTITGQNFIGNSNDVSVIFNGGVIAETQAASATSVTTIVPKGALSGPIVLLVGSQQVIGPDFAVVTKGTISVDIFTEGPEPTDFDPDGYQLIIGTDTTTVPLDQERTYLNNLDPGIYEIKLSGLKPNCVLEENMTRVVQVFDHDTTALVFNIHCEEKQQQIIYASDVLGDYNIYTADITCCEQPMQLTFDRTQDRYPSVSPDGAWIAYIATAFSYNRLLVVSADGCCEPIELASDVTTAFGARLEWSPDGSQIAFLQGINIATVSVSGNTPPVLLTDSIDFENYPRWSPDGTKILFSANYNGEQALYTKEVNDTQAPVKITPDSLSAGKGSWSPDGTEIVFLSNSEDDIFIIDAAGGTLMRLTDDAVVKDLPKWSPDGTQVAYMTIVLDGGLQTELYVMDAQEGANPTAVTSQIINEYSGFEWSPAGSQFVCQTLNAPEVVFTVDNQGVLLERVSNQTSSNVDPKWGGKL